MLHFELITHTNQWEQAIAAYSPQSFFQSWVWGDIIGGVQRYGAVQNGKLVGVAQVERINAKRGSFLRVRHGPILEKWGNSESKEWFSFLISLGKKENVGFLRISPLIHNTPKHEQIFYGYGWRDAPIHAMDGEYCWVLDIRRSEEELLLGMRKTTRYLIKQAKKMQVEIRQGTKKDLNIFFDLYHTTAKRQGFVPHKGIEEEFDRLSSDDNIKLFLGTYQGKVLSAALIVFYQHQAIYHHSASIDQKIPVNYLLQWEAIREAKKRGKTEYNFWGIAPEGSPRHPWKGLSEFKKGFGGHVHEYLHAKDYPLQSSYWLTYGVEVARKIWKGY